MEVHRFIVMDCLGITYFGLEGNDIYRQTVAPFFPSPVPHKMQQGRGKAGWLTGTQIQGLFICYVPLASNCTSLSTLKQENRTYLKPGVVRLSQAFYMPQVLRIHRLRLVGLNWYFFCLSKSMFRDLKLYPRPLVMLKCIKCCCKETGISSNDNRTFLLLYACCRLLSCVPVHVVSVTTQCGQDNHLQLSGKIQDTWGLFKLPKIKGLAKDCYHRPEDLDQDLSWDADILISNSVQLSACHEFLRWIC